MITPLLAPSIRNSPRTGRENEHEEVADHPLHSAAPGTLRGAARRLRTERRYRQVLRAVSSGLMSKGINLAVNLVLVPVMLRSLGAENYGLWVTITSSVNMFVLLDIGIANTLTNLIAEAYAADDRERAAEYFSSAFWTVCAVTAVLGALAWVAWPHIPWASLFHVTESGMQQPTARAAGVATAVLLCSLPAGLAARVFGGFQELHITNIFAAAGSLMSLAGVLLALHFSAGLPVLVGSYAAPLVLASVASLGWLVLFHKPWMKPFPRRLRRAHVARILRSGGQFFVIQLAGVVVMNSDNLVLSHYLSPAAVTPYNVTWRLISYVLALQGLPVGAMWPAIAEAYARHDFPWIRAAYRRMRTLTLVILAVACAVLVPFGKNIIRLWAGPAAVPGTGLLLLMCTWMCLCAITIYQANLMGAVSRVGRQALSSGVAAVVNLALSIWWVHTMGQTGVILATVVSYTVFVVAVQVCEVRGILKSGTTSLKVGAAHA